MAFKRLLALPVIAASALLLGLGTAWLPFMEPYGLKSLDMQFLLLAQAERADPRIVVIEVDQASLDHFERDNIPFPWPRTLYAPIVQYAAAAGAEAVIFDILFNNLSPYGTEIDEEFGAALGAAGNAFLATATGRNPADERARHAAERFGLALTGDPLPGTPYTSVSTPLAPILAGAAGIGSVSLRPDADGIYRRVTPLSPLLDRRLPALFAAPLAHGLDSVAHRDGLLALGDHPIPLDAEGAAWINYHAPRGGYRRYPAATLIRSALAFAAGETPAIPPEALRGAYLFVGYTAAGLFDLKPTPLSSVTPGVEVQAAALDNLLNGDFLQRASAAWTLQLAAFGAVAVSAAALLTPPLAAGAIALLALALQLAAAAAAFRHGYWFNLVALLTPTLLALIAAALYRYQVEGRRRRFIQTAFGHYLSPNVVKQVLADPERLHLGGERRELTVLFSDLAGFTTLAERLAADELVRLLNGYTTMMADLIADHDGTVDKYIGDAVMAFWNAPVAQADHARLAVAAALEGQRRLAAFRDTIEGGEVISMRVGVSSGECVVGNMGSERRFDYTAIGDAVNQASRLEGLNKAYGTPILVAESTWGALGGAFFGRRIDYLCPKGKINPVWVYQPLAPKGAETQAQRRLAEAYEAAHAAYRARHWDEAASRLQAILSESEDPPSRVLLERVAGYRDAPPPEGWNGAHVHTTK